MRARLTTPLPPRLDASAFPVETPLNAFFAWNEARFVRDRRYIIACDIYRLLREFGGDTEICLAHLLGQPVIRRRFGQRFVVSATRLRAARAGIEGCQGSLAVAAGERQAGPVPVLGRRRVAQTVDELGETPLLVADHKEVEHMGADRVIFGSDWPHIEGMPRPLDYAAELKAFDDDTQRKILRDNARELNTLRPA